MSPRELPACLLEPVTQLTAEWPGIGGVIKKEIADFTVEEIPAYEPCGAGEHLYLWVEKRDMGAEYFQRQVAQRLGIHAADIGTAGLKDRRAITRQWVSVPVRCEAQVNQVDGEGIAVLKVSKHGNKLRPGHLRGNRFGIVIRDVTSTDSLPGILEKLRQWGLPNYYGEQRFGRDQETLHLGWSMLQGERVRAGAFLRKLALSAVQSILFNRCLSQRLRDGLFTQVLMGDVMGKLPAGGMFVSQDPVVDQARFDAREIVHTGPMFGSKMRAAENAAHQREMQLLQECQLSLEHFRIGGKLLEGTRRHNIVCLHDLEYSITDQTVSLNFSLPAGSYATVLLAEMTKLRSPDPVDGD